MLGDQAAPNKVCFISLSKCFVSSHFMFCLFMHILFLDMNSSILFLFVQSYHIIPSQYHMWLICFAGMLLEELRD